LGGSVRLIFGFWVAERLFVWHRVMRESWILLLRFESTYRVC